VAESCIFNVMKLRYVFHFVFIIQVGKVYSLCGCFVKDLKPDFNLCLKIIIPRICAKLLLFQLRGRNCISKCGILITFVVSDNCFESLKLYHDLK
jgi:hypothetical protein